MLSKQKLPPICFVTTQVELWYHRCKDGFHCDVVWSRSGSWGLAMDFPALAHTLLLAADDLFLLLAWQRGTPGLCECRLEGTQDPVWLALQLIEATLDCSTPHTSRKTWTSVCGTSWRTSASDTISRKKPVTSSAAPWFEKSAIRRKKTSRRRDTAARFLEMRQQERQAQGKEARRLG